MRGVDLRSQLDRDSERGDKQVRPAGSAQTRIHVCARIGKLVRFHDRPCPIAGLREIGSSSGTAAACSPEGASRRHCGISKEAAVSPWAGPSPPLPAGLRAG
jgi:hypothetical protein